MKAGKRMYCDLMFTNENESFIRWLENLDSVSQKAIFENRKKWFETELEEHDIENSFTPPLKVYKSGKYYIVRVNIPIVLGKPNLKIYDDHEVLVDIDAIRENENVATILEIQGVKCSPRSFQIEIEMKQLLILKPVDLFDRCVFKVDREPEPTTVVAEPTTMVAEPATMVVEPTTVVAEPATMVVEPIATVAEPTNVVAEPIATLAEPIVNVVVQELEEIELPLEEISNSDTMFIKERNDVYYEMYKEALRKAKTAKNIALASYLEAKRIKNTYMLTELNDEDSDFDDDLGN